MPHEVHITQTPRRDLAVVRTATTFPGIPAVMGQAFDRVAAYLGPLGLLGNSPAVGLYTDMDLQAGTLTVSAGFRVGRPVEGDGTVVPGELPATEVATTTHVGPYEKVSEAYDAIAAAMALQGRELDESTMWEEYWSPPGTPDEDTVTEVFCPLKPAA